MVSGHERIAILLRRSFSKIRMMVLRAQFDAVDGRGVERVVRVGRGSEAAIAVAGDGVVGVGVVAVGG